MSTPSKFEITLSFKAVMDGLNQYVNGYQRRMAEVQAFNARIAGGASALQQMVGQAGALLGGASIVQALTRMTKSGVEFNAQLEQARLGIAAVLKQFDERGRFKSFDDALAASGEAIEILKQKAITSPASFASLVMAFQGTVGPMTAAGIRLRDQVNLIVNMSQALAGLGIQEAQILQETRALITGNINADAAAAKILNITAADISAAKQQGQLYEFLSGKIAAFAEAGERGATTLATLRSNFGDALQQRAAAATLNLTESLRRLFVQLTAFAQTATFSGFLQLVADKTQMVVDFLTRLVTWLQTVDGSNLIVVAGAIADLAVIVVGAAAAIALLKGSIGLLMMVLAPLRAAFVLLSGMSLLELNNILAACTAGMGRMATVSYILRDGMASAAGAGRLLAISLTLALAAFAGWQLGKLINELEVSGLKVKDWAAIFIVAVQDKIGGAFASLQTVWVYTRNAWDTFRLYVQGTVLEMAITIAEAWNKLPFGSKAKIDIEPWRAAAADVAAEVAGLDSKLQERLNAINQARAAQLLSNAELIAYIKEQGTSAPAGAAPAPGADLSGGVKGSRPGDAKAAQLRAEQEQKRALFDLETAILEAQADGNQALVERLTRERDELQLLKELGTEAYDLIQARLDVEREAKQQTKSREAEERALALQLSELGLQRARIEADRLLSAEEKQRRVVALLREENALIAARIAALERERAAGVTEERRGQINETIDQLGGQAGQNAGAIEGQRPLSLFEQVQADMTAFMDGFGTRMQAIANLFSAPLKAGIGAVRNGLQGLLGDTDFWSAKLGRVAGPIMGALTGSVADLFAQWIAGRARAALASMLWSAKEGAADTAAKTPGALLTSISSFGVAAAVGVAAVIAAMAAFATGGLVRGPGTGTSDSIMARLSNGEFVNRAATVERFGPAFFESLDNGVLDLGALPGNVARQLPTSGGSSQGSGGAAAGGTPGGRDRRYIMVAPDMVSARQLARDPEFENVIMDVWQRRRGEMLDS